MKKKRQKKIKKKKCTHPWLNCTGDPCSACGFIEGTCGKCGIEVMGYVGEELKKL